jgi:hypothetical protein
VAVRRAVVVAVCVALVATACGTGHRPRSEPGKPASLDSVLKRRGQDVAAVAGDEDFVPGDVRFSFLVIRNDARPVERPRARVWVARSRSAAPFLEATAKLEPIGIPGMSEPASGGVHNIYVVHLRVRRPGRYWLVAEPVGARIQALANLDVKRRSDSPALGARAPASMTPTFESAHGRTSKLTTRIPPDRALLRYSIAGSLAARKPFVVTFATPRYCASRTCGPVVDVVDLVRRVYEGSGIRFIHVEVYTDNNPQRGYNRWMKQWGLQTEPWTFLVGRDGRIKAKFEGSLSVAELSTAVRRFLS